MADVLLDAVLDTLKLLPFLFVTYLVLEFIEEKAEEGSLKLVRHSGVLGPVLGSALGLIPQCGFSASASSLFAQRLISAGTLIAVFLSTSDEMLPILISSAVPPLTILEILGVKLAVGMAAGLTADKLLRLCRHEGERVDLHQLCEEENCGCEEHGVFLSSLLHTLKIAAFILIINLSLGLVLHFVGQEKLSGLLLDRPVVGPVISGLVGLIPNCAASILITQLYVSGALSAGSMIAGLLTASGVGMLVLFRINRRAMRDNAKILGYVLVSGVAVGILMDLLGIAF